MRRLSQWPFSPNVTALQQTRYQVDAIRDLGNRVGALVEGYSVVVPF